MRKTALNAPFLKRLTLLPERMEPGVFPFNLSILDGGRLELTFERPITFFIGDNGTGKSTLLEAIARQCGFNLGGGSRDHRYANDPHDSELAPALRLSWLPKITDGFFLRAESFFNFATYIDEVSPAEGNWQPRYGEKSLHLQSHGQAFFAIFQHRLGDDSRGIYLLDEPEAALAPGRQIEFLALLHEWGKTGKFQFIIATHSPIIMACPNASLLSFDGGNIHPVAYRETDHFRITRRFLMDHESYLERLFAPEEEQSAEDDD